MKYLFKVLVLVMMLMLSVDIYSKTENEQIKGVFDAYLSAVRERRGEEAVKFLSESTLRHYEKLIYLSIHGGKTDVLKLPLSDQVTTLFLRGRMKAGDLEQMTDQSAVAKIITNGWIGSEIVLPLKFKKITRQGSRAIMYLGLDGQKGGMEISFVKEAGMWAIDLLPLFQLIDARLKEHMSGRELSEEAFVVETVDSVLKQKIGQDIWTPLRDRTIPIR